jgi:hypothetical protein
MIERFANEVRLDATREVMMSGRDGVLWREHSVDVRRRITRLGTVRNEL